MTRLDLPKGTCLTVDGIAATVDRVALDAGSRKPIGHWVTPVPGHAAPTVPFVLRADAVPAKLLDGTLAIGATAAHEPVAEVARYAGMDIGSAPRELAAVALERLTVLEAFYGVRDGAARKAVNAATAWKEIAAALQLRGGKKPQSVSTIRRHDRTFVRSGRNRNALVPRHRFKGNRERRVPEFVIDAVEAAIDQAYTGKGSGPEVVDAAIALAKRMVPADLSQFTKRRRIKDTDRFETVSMIERRADGSIDWERLVTPNFVRQAIRGRSALDRACMVHGMEDGKEMFAVTGQGPETRHLLHRTEIDNFRLAVFVVDAELRLPLGYPWVTVLLDVASRAIVGLHIGFMPPSGETVAECLKHAVMPKDLSWTGTWPDGSPVITQAWPMFGGLSLVACDQGADFISDRTRDGCYRIGMNLLPLPPGKPKLKGKVERFIKTLKHGKVGRILGIVGTVRELRGGDGPLVLTLEELRLILTYWIVEIYHQRRHETLGMSPQQAWDELAGRMAIVPPPSPQEMQLCIGRWDTRTIDDQGIRINGLKYNSPGLGTLRKLRARDGDGGRLRDVDVKSDDADIERVWAMVEDPQNKGSTIAVEAWCTQPEYAGGGLSLHQHLVIKEYAKEKAPVGRITVRQLIDARLELNEIADQILGDRKRKGGHVKVARYLGIGRMRLTDCNDTYDEEASQRLLDLKDEEVGDPSPKARGPKASQARPTSAAEATRDGTAPEDGAAPPCRRARRNARGRRDDGPARAPQAGGHRCLTRSTAATSPATGRTPCPRASCR